MASKFQGVDSYDIDAGEKFALIINVIKDRPRAEKDTTKLKETLESCGFKVIIVPDNDHTNEGIRRAIANFKLILINSVAVCSLVAVMSHGRKSNLFQTLDGELNFDNEIVLSFNNKNCHGMKDKPKIFLANFCRFTPTYIDTDSNFGKGESESALDSFGTNSDLLVCMATFDDYAALRDTIEGTWFIQSFCEMLSQHGNGEVDFQEIMIKVFDHVNTAWGSPSFRQCPTFLNAGFKKLFLKYSSISQIPKSYELPPTLLIPPIATNNLNPPSPHVVIPIDARPIIQTVKATEVANVMADEAGIIEDIVPFFEKLPKVTKADWWHKYCSINNPGSGGYKKLIREILIIWVSKNGDSANVPALIDICKNEGLADLKRKLESMAWREAKVLQ